MKVTAVIRPEEKKDGERIMQGDIFKNIKIIENIDLKDDGTVRLQEITFPLVMCINQDCDLYSDYCNRINKVSNGLLLHLIIVPLFDVANLKQGTNWGEVMAMSSTISGKTLEQIKKNVEPRYHYLLFPDKNIPEMIADFKYFFTVNRDYLYNRITDRVCSIDDLFREKINQRFSEYISRIGLPEIEIQD